MSDYLNKDMLMGLAILNPIVFYLHDGGCNENITNNSFNSSWIYIRSSFLFFISSMVNIIGGFVAGSVAFIIGELNGS
jgi:hypothetical protein